MKLKISETCFLSQSPTSFCNSKQQPWLNGKGHGEGGDQKASFNEVLHQHFFYPHPGTFFLLLLKRGRGTEKQTDTQTDRH